MPSKGPAYCSHCGHKMYFMIACKRVNPYNKEVKCNGYEERKDISVKDDVHGHCNEGCLCTTEGCIEDE